MSEVVYFLVHIRGEYVTGAPIKSMWFDLFHVAWARKLHHYTLTRGQISLYLYLSCVNGGYLSCGIFVMLWLASVSIQHIYPCMQNYVLIV